MKLLRTSLLWTACSRWAAIGVLATALSASQAEEFRFESAGARGGFSASDVDHEFHQAEAFGNWFLPWGLDFGAGWQLKTRADLSVGWLGNRDGDAVVGTLGPSVIVKHERFPLSLEGGSSPTLISRHEFGSENFGIPFQFTSHVDLNVDLVQHLRLSYRFQHMSNAGLGDHNPGLNMHLFGVSYLF